MALNLASPNFQKITEKQLSSLVGADSWFLLYRLGLDLQLLIDVPSATIKNDLGVLYTSTPIEFSATIRPIFLDFELVGADVVSRAAGWGRIRHQGSISAQLLELDVLTVSGPTCVQEVARIAAANNIRPPAVEPHIELCTSHPVGAGHGMCNGDSGSALVRRDRGTQIGIVSWGIPCARGAPDMFVRVSAYEDWFQTYIRN